MGAGEPGAGGPQDPGDAPGHGGAAAPETPAVGGEADPGEVAGGGIWEALVF